MARFIPKQFAENSTTSVVFGSFQEQGGNVGDGTISSDPATLQGGTAWPLGWSAATDNFFQIPRGEEMEGLERVLSAAIVQQFKDGLTFWQSEMPVTQYQTIVQYQTGSDLPKLYINITGTSTSTPPDSDTTNWKEMSFGDRINTPFFFGQSMYFENDPYNASWLASNGQYNASSLYPDFWTQLTGVELNGSLNVGDTIEISGKTYVKRGLSVVLSTGTITDYDFVVNQNDQTFRLPLKTKLASGSAVAGNGMTLGMTNGTQIGGLVQTGANGLSSLYAVDNQYGANVGTSEIAGGTVLDWKKSVGITTDPTKSGIETASDGLKLYFYVGDVVQDASLINAGAVLGQLANKADIDASNFNTAGKSLLSGLGMPSNRYINLTLGASGSSYTAPANGWFVVSKQSSNSLQYMQISKQLYIQTLYSPAAGDRLDISLPALKGDVVSVNYSVGGNTEYFRFIYAEGEN